MKELNKEIRDFSTKYLYQISKFNINIFKKMLKYIDANDINFVVSYIDTDYSLQILDGKISSIKIEPYNPYYKIPIHEKEKSYDIRDMVITSIIYLKRDLPRMLKYSEMVDHQMERLIKHDDSDVLKENYKTIIDLKESKILYMIEYCKKVYTYLPKLLKRT